MIIHPIACLTDNYAYLVIDPDSMQAAIVDPSEADPVARKIAACEKALGKIHVTAIWATHHHHDHVGGIESLAHALAITSVYGHESDQGRIPMQSVFLRDGDAFSLGAIRVRAMHVPGHTRGAVAYVATDAESDAAVFTGDTMFVAGCGRLFEGDAAMMCASLSRIAALDSRTRVYCGHEYTESNLRFALSIDPDNANVQQSIARCRERRAAHQPTVPSTVADEREHNPFLRVNSHAIRDALHLSEASTAVEVFARVRQAKDVFR